MTDERRGHLSPLFTWRSAICLPAEQQEREHGAALPSTTRHVALVLSLHMSELGSSCYPSQGRLATETNLSRKTVNQHLQKLEEEGWIQHDGWKKWETAGGEQKTKRWRACLPRVGQSVTPLPEGCESDAEGCESLSERVGRRFTQGRQEDDRGRSGRTPARGNGRPSGPGDVTPSGKSCPDCGEELRVRSEGLYCTRCADWKRPVREAP